MSNRTFQVNIKNKCANVGKVDCYKPQGSIIVSLLFQSYVNETFQPEDYVLSLYTDDSCLIYHHRYMRITEQKFEIIGKCLRLICQKQTYYLLQKKQDQMYTVWHKKEDKGSDFDIRGDLIYIKQNHTVTCFGCVLTKTC